MRSGQGKMLALLFVASFIFASTEAPAQAQRKGRIVLPRELATGMPATLGVLGPDGHTEATVQILLSDGETLTTDESGRAHFLAPASPGILFARIQGTEDCAAGEVQKPEDAAKLSLDAATRLDPLNGQVEIRGSGFDGDADKNEVILGASRALVLAASPSELFVLPPPDSQPGMTELNLTISGQTASTPITLVRVDAPLQNFSQRKKKRIKIRIIGTVEPVSLQIHNNQPDVVQVLSKGDLLQTIGGTDNSVEIRLKGLRTGEFSLSVQIIRKIDAASMPVARDFLKAARKIAPTAEKSIFEDVLGNLRKNNPDVSALRVQLQKLASEDLAGDYGALIRAAKESLFGPE